MAGTWQDVESTVGAEKAAEMRKEAEVELATPEYFAQAMSAMSGGVTVEHGAQALFVLGPSAAGKSYALQHGSVEVPPGALELDGEIMREVSTSWKKAIALAEESGLGGFSDYFEAYFKKPTDAVKKRVVDSAIESRSNLKIPDTASNVERTKKQVDRLLAAGYRLKFVAVYADPEVCERRGTQRESLCGKKYSNKNWEASVKAILEINAYLQEKGILDSTGGVKVINNTGAPCDMSLDEVEHVLKHTSGGKSVLLAGGWCETQLLAGHYKCEATDVEMEVLPSNLEDENVDVSLKRLAPGKKSDNDWVFDITTCTIRTKLGLPTYALKVDADGTPTLHAAAGGLQEVFKQVRPLAGMSLSFPISKDSELKAALDGLDFCQSSCRALNEDEFQRAAVEARLRGPGAAESKVKPKALYIVAPSAGGKTHVMQKLAGSFGIQLQQAVSIDSAVFRDCHPQYRALINNGRANHGLWYRAWPAAKGVLSKAKSRLQKEAMANKQDMLISDTGHDAGKLLKSIEDLKAQGYNVSLCGIFADPQEILARGLARELDDGKRYNRSLEKLMQTFNVFAPAVQAVNGQFWIVSNLVGRQPEVYMKGMGGRAIEFNLKAALAAVSGEPEETYIDPKDLSYIMEGNLNVVCAYTGASKQWEGKVLRCRKADSSSYKADCAFAKGVVIRAFGEQYVDPGELVSISPANAKAIDEAIFSSRPSSRQSKRLDVEPRCDGHVLALRVANLMGTPIKGLKTITVELKVKCCLNERQGLPSRYRLLQQEKLRAGKISRVSEYDPVKMLSKDPQKIYEALAAAFDEPQNNLRIFLDGKGIFSEGMLKKAASPDALAKDVDDKLAEIGVSGGRDALFAYLSGLLSQKAMQMPERLKRIQAWAAGETALLVNELYSALLQRVGADKATKLLAHLKNFELAVQGLEEMPCDEAGIDAATKGMDDILERAGSTEEWNEALEREVVVWICRFLLGRTAHDVSVLINFVVKRPEGLSQAEEDLLRSQRFTPLEMLGLPSEDKWTKFWTRTTIVDTDLKDPHKIPEYATQLDQYAETYYQRYRPHPVPAQPASSTTMERKPSNKAEAVGGHADSINFEGGTVWKKDQGGAKGQKEFFFLRWALDQPDTVGLIPRLTGYRVNNGVTFIGMESATHGLSDPSILDLKMGTRTWTPDASPEKCASQAKKAAESTTGSLGVRVVGGKVRDANGVFVKYGMKCGNDIVDEDGVKRVLAEMLPTPALRRSAMDRIEAIGKWWESQSEYAFYASSLLLACDTPTGEACKVYLIDFANCEPIKEKSKDLSGFKTGLDTLARVFASITDKS
mmetsp:Transcript_2311/g.4828  ORF Transcript_2311/g.4828 Transcript_2311/m.4828 type:complete len:1317 (-) Transcript_2311:48-3998(-)